MLIFFEVVVAVCIIFSLYRHFFAEKTPENKSDNALYEEEYYFQQAQENGKQKSDFSEFDDEEDDFLDDDDFDGDDDFDEYDDK